jgi:GDP-L-fucose synthase
VVPRALTTDVAAPVGPTLSDCAPAGGSELDLSGLRTGAILVTGASGVVGTALSSVLGALGCEFVALSSADCDLRQLDATSSLFESLRPSSVIHLAGRVRGVLGNHRAPGEMYLDNLLINTNVVEASRRAGVEKIVAMGSVSMYPDGVPQPMSEKDLWAGEPHPSERGYAHAKRSMLAQLELYREQYGLDYALAVSTNLYGPNDRFDEEGGHVVPSLISKFHRAITEGGDVIAWGSGSPTRDFLYSEDAARALLAMLAGGSGVYNFATGRPVTIRHLIETMAEVTGFEGEVIWDSSKPEGQGARSYDVSRLYGLGWTPEVDLRDGLRRSFEWYSMNAAAARRAIA